MAETRTFDAVVIGSGFGGAVTACRLAEKGYSVLVLERDRGECLARRLGILALVLGRERLPAA